MSVLTTGETSTDYAHPYRPRAIAALNRVGGLLSRAGVQPPLRVASLYAAARRKTGLEDFGSEPFETALATLVESVEREARLTLAGRLITRLRLVSLLTNQLRMVDLCRRHPEITAAPVASPIIVTGLQRTGTTLLHRLLGATPGARTVASWEALDPVGPRKRWAGAADRRRAAAVRAERALAYMAPDFFAIHPVEADSPEEEVVLLDHAFLSSTPEATMQVPSYAAWVEAQDHGPAYRTLRLILQVLQWQRPGTHWVLKTPHHLEWLETLLAVFPDATVVQTHRDPQVTMASFCSMVAHARGVFSDHVDPLEIGRHWSRKCARLVHRAMEARDRLDGARFVDVHYDALVADPMAQVRRVREAAGRPLDAEATAAVEAALRTNRKDRYGKHVYRLSDFGLTPEGFETMIAAYRDRYAIPRIR